jgi:hypothetical protein
LQGSTATLERRGIKATQAFKALTETPANMGILAYRVARVIPAFLVTPGYRETAVRTVLRVILALRDHKETRELAAVMMRTRLAKFYSQWTG